MTTREAFESFITSPPFEMPIERFDDRSAWPGGYTELEVDLAWKAWKASHDAAQAEIDKLQAQLVHQQASYEAEIKVEIDAALERAAEVCDEIKAVYTARYVAARAKTPNNLDFLDGASDGAEECASAIRALKDSDTC